MSILTALQELPLKFNGSDWFLFDNESCLYKQISEFTLRQQIRRKFKDAYLSDVLLSISEHKINIADKCNFNIEAWKIPMNDANFLIGKRTTEDLFTETIRAHRLETINNTYYKIIMNYFNTLLSGDVIAIDNLFSCMRAIFRKEPSKHNVMIFLSGSASGKSTFCCIMKALLGHYYVSIDTYNVYDTHHRLQTITPLLVVSERNIIKSQLQKDTLNLECASLWFFLESLPQMESYMYLRSTIIVSNTRFTQGPDILSRMTQPDVLNTLYTMLI